MLYSVLIIVLILANMLFYSTKNHNYQLSYVFIFLLVLSTLGCRHLDNIALQNITSTMNEAESFMIDNPQLAYNLLDKIDYTSIKRNKDKAKYALLFTEAQYKNYYYIENDSLIKVAVLYYSKHKKWDYLFRSYYSLGCVYSLLKLYPDAAVAFAQANELIDYVKSDFQKGLLFSRMGDIFYDCYDYNRAEYYYINATFFFDKAGRDYYTACAKGSIANCRVQTGDYYGSIDIYNELIDWTDSVDSLNLKRQYMSNKYLCLVICGEEEPQTSLESNIMDYEYSEKSFSILNILARYHISKHDFIHARELIDKAWTAEPVDSVNILFTESLYYEQEGDYNKALYYYRESMSFNKQKALKVLSQPMIGAQSQYYRAVSELESLKARHRLILFFTTLILLLLIMVATTLFIINRKRKTNEQIRQNLYAIDELTARDSISQNTIHNLNELLKEKSESIENLNERIIDLSASESLSSTKIQQLNLKVRKMLRQQYELPDYLYTRYYEQIDDNKKAERLYKIVKNQIAEFTNSKNIERLDKMLNDTFGDLMNKLSSPILELKQKEKLLLRLVLTDISAKSMAAILNDTNQNINQRKKRLLEKIGRKDPQLLVELIEALNS